MVNFNRIICLHSLVFDKHFVICYKCGKIMK